MRTEPIHSFVMYASAIRFIERPIEGDKATDVEKGEEYTYHNGKWSKTAELEAAEEAINEDEAVKEKQLEVNSGEAKPKRRSRKVKEE